MARDIYQDVTDRIVAALERGVAPWIQPWTNGGSAAGADRNARTGKAYNGVNVLVLWSQRELAGWRSPLWLTYQQAQELGGHVRKGEKGTQIVFWKVTEGRQVEGTSDAGDESEGNRRVLARSYTVFNVEQCEGLELDTQAPAEPEAEELPRRLEAVRLFCLDTGADIRHGGNRAAYFPGAERDFIKMPPRPRFKSDEHYFATMLHELTHWTSAPQRCSRELGRRFGDMAYAAEELIAELGAAFACAELGIHGELQHADYIASWLKVLKSDKRAIFTAASKARKAIEYLHSVQPEAKPVAA